MPPELGSAFEDRAWEDMRQLLDQEMPVRKEKRRLIWWWWGGLVAVGLVAFIGLFFISPVLERENAASEQTIISDKAISNHQEKIAVDQENRFIENKMKPVPVITDSEQMLKSESLKNTSIKLPFPSTEPTKNEVSEGKIATILQGTAVPLDNTISSLPNFSTVKTEEINTPESTVLNTLEVITQEEVTSSPLVAKSDTITEFREKLSYHDLSILPITPAPLLEIPPIYPPLNKTITPLPSKWKWGLTATIGTFKLTRINEYGIGLFTSYQATSKWQFQTGFTYHFLRLNLLDSTANLDKGQNTMDVLEVESDTSGGAETSPTSEEGEEPSLPSTNVPEDNRGGAIFQDTNVLLGIGRVHYLSMPLRIHYQLNSNFSVGAGTTMYYALQDSYDREGQSGASLRKWDLTSSIGVALQAHPSVQLQLNYERGWFQNRKNLQGNATTVAGLDGRYSPFMGRIRLSGIYVFGSSTNPVK